jgi:aryl-alcohol dehydrogenase-like predicted oxidoreductase
MWQVSGAHGYIEPKRAVKEMFTYHDAGFTTWDLADHYGPAEDFVGKFRKEFAARRGRERLSEIQAFTKWVSRSGPSPQAMRLLNAAAARASPGPHGTDAAPDT